MKVVVTGANGFVGVPTCRRLLAQGHQVVAAVRRADVLLPLDVDICPVGDLGPNTCWRRALDGADAVIHLAARAHVLRDRVNNPEIIFDKLNHLASAALAQQAAEAGISRFVLVSSIKANGEVTSKTKPFQASDIAAPSTAYGRSKVRAEAIVSAIAQQKGMSLAIIRPPLVHGPGLKGNLAILVRALRLGLPLPLGAVDNLRSMVGVDNLADALVFLAQSQHQGCYLIRDDEDISTPELIRILAAAMRRPAHLVAVPPALLRFTAAILGRSDSYDRLAESLLVDDAPLRALGWRPRLGLAEGLRLTVCAG